MSEHEFCLRKPSTTYPLSLPTWYLDSSLKAASTTAGSRVAFARSAGLSLAAGLPIFFRKAAENRSNCILNTSVGYTPPKATGSGTTMATR